MKKRLLLFLPLFVCLNVMAPSFINHKKISENTQNELRISHINTRLNHLRYEAFSYENLYDYLSLVNAVHQEIIIRQVILETGYFSSSLFKQNNNLFGMKMPNRRQTTAIAEKDGYAQYFHWTRSVDDYLILQQLWKFKHLYAFYDGYSLLGLASYAEDTDYINLLKHIKIPLYDNTTYRNGHGYRG